MSKIDLMMAEHVANRFMLALCIWREARAEPLEGRVAVAFTVLNRAKHPGWWGNDVYSVVTKPWQYSSITAPGDKQLHLFPKLSDTTWLECLQVASDVLDGDVPNPVPGADSYFADYIPAPKWATADKFVRQIGHHLFYNLDGDPQMKV